MRSFNLPNPINQRYDLVTQLKISSYFIIKCDALKQKVEEITQMATTLDTENEELRSASSNDQQQVASLTKKLQLSETQLSALRSEMETAVLDAQLQAEQQLLVGNNQISYKMQMIHDTFRRCNKLRVPCPMSLVPQRETLKA